MAGRQFNYINSVGMPMNQYAFGQQHALQMQQLQPFNLNYDQQQLYPHISYNQTETDFKSAYQKPSIYFFFYSKSSSEES